MKEMLSRVLSAHVIGIDAYLVPILPNLFLLQQMNPCGGVAILPLEFAAQ